MPKPLPLSEVAARIGGQVEGDPDWLVEAVGTADAAGPHTLCVVWDAAYAATLDPAVPIVAVAAAFGDGRRGVSVRDPRGTLPALLPLFAEEPSFPAGIHPTAWVDPTAVVDPSASIGPQCVVEAGATIAAGVVLESLVHVGRGASIGDGTRIWPHVVLHAGTEVGARVRIHGGTVVGCDGFGFIPDGKGGQRKIPQIGRVRIEDDVEIGALCTVDRATLGTTRIGAGSKLDSHVHVGHNVDIGRGCVIVAQTGIAGSVVLGDQVTLASRVGVVPHIKVGAKAVVGGNCGVTTDVPAGGFVSGFPSQEHRKELRQQALLRKLPDLFDRLKKLEAALAAAAAPRPASDEGESR